MGAVDDESAVVESNERLVEAFLTAYVGGAAGAIADLVTDDCVLHRPRWPLDTEGKSAIVGATRTNEGDVH